MFLYLAILHQRQEPPFVYSPVALFDLKLLQHDPSRSQKRSMNVLDAADYLQKVCEVVRLGETRELGGIVESYVDQLFYASPSEALKEILCRRLSKTYCRYLDLVRHACSSVP